MVREKVNVSFGETTGPVDRDGLVAMPRPPRLQYSATGALADPPRRSGGEGALYHVYTRGNHREVTFRDEADYHEFESTLLDLCDRLEIHLYAWCLMPNHFHLLPETPNANLAAFMQRLLSRYVHYLGGNEPMAVKAWIHAVLRRFGDEIQEARGRYDAFVAEGLAGGRWEDFYQLKGKAFLGSDRFVQEHQASKDDLGALRLKAQRRTLAELSQAVCEDFSIPEQELRSRSRARHASRARQALCLVARKLAISSTSQLAKYLQRDPSVISHLLGSVERSEESAEVKALVERMTRQGVACGQ